MLWMGDVTQTTPPDHPEKVGLPPVTFLYTLDQVANMLCMSVESFVSKYVYFMMVSRGVKSPHEMMARNIAKPGDKPDWRIPQAEFVRWLKLKGFKVQALGRVT